MPPKPAPLTHAGIVAGGSMCAQSPARTGPMPAAAGPPDSEARGTSTNDKPGKRSWLLS